MIFVVFALESLGRVIREYGEMLHVGDLSGILFDESDPITLMDSTLRCISLSLSLFSPLERFIPMYVLDVDVDVENLCLVVCLDV